jgi:hypothetical protein
MDPSNRTLDSMISVPHPSQLGEFVSIDEGRPSKRRGVAVEEQEGAEETPVELEEDDGDINNSMWTKGTVVIPESECEFTSILELRREASARGNEGML